MKKLSLIVMAIAAISVIWVSCGKEEVITINPDRLLSDKEIGIAHNTLVRNYLNTSNNRSGEDISLAEKIEIVDDYFVENGWSPLFSDYLDNSADLYSFLEQINGDTPLESEHRAVFENLHNQGKSSDKELEAQNRLIDITYAEVSTFEEKINSFDNYKTELNADTEFTLEEKEKLNTVIELSKASVAFWDGINIEDLDITDKVSWYAQDIAGAAYAATSGLSNVGLTLGGPWGWLGVTLGAGAISSMIPNR